MKILITGGLGYIGTELCEIYSGESRFKEITVIDKRFVSILRPLVVSCHEKKYKNCFLAEN